MKKRNLYIIGAGELAREVESWISLDEKFKCEWNIVGFLDRNLHALDNYPSDFDIIGVPEDFCFEKDDAVIICIAHPLIKERIIKKIKSKVEIITYISPFAIIAKFVTINEGSLICPNCIISTNTIIEKYATINCGTLIGHDCTIGEYSSLMSNVDLGGHVSIGEKCFLGTKATIIPQRKIGNEITLGAGSVAMRNLKQKGTYIGNPAIIMKY